MRKNKNGFTLIELLAVIVVLAIIMVIATMQINKTLLKSRTNAFIQSAEQVVKVAKNLQVSSELNTYNLRKAVDYSSSEYQIYVYEYNPAYECHAYTYNASAADKLNEINNNYSYKFITSNPVEASDKLLQIPVSLLTLDDMALLLQADKHAQLPIIENTIKLARIFATDSEESRNYKNHLIAKALLAVLFSNETI